MFDPGAIRLWVNQFGSTGRLQTGRYAEKTTFLTQTYHLLLVRFLGNPPLGKGQTAQLHRGNDGMIRRLLLRHSLLQTTWHNRQQVYVNRMSNPAIKRARSTRLATSICSFRVCKPSPRTPNESRVGMPKAPVKFPSEPPP